MQPAASEFNVRAASGGESAAERREGCASGQTLQVCVCVRTADGGREGRDGSSLRDHQRGAVCVPLCWLCVTVKCEHVSSESPSTPIGKNGFINE